MRKRGRQKKNTRKRAVKGELKTIKNTWGIVENMAREEQNWRTFVVLHVIGIPGSKK